MSHSPTSFIELLKRDQRYRAEAYAFVYEALSYAQSVLESSKKEIYKSNKSKSISEENLTKIKNQEQNEITETDFGNHVTGQELCKAARKYAISQYGFLAKTVLNSIGIRKTDDIGNIVYNLISIGQMRKTPQDNREDFTNVFDFETAFAETYQIHSGNT
ncbi:MAG: hypothetical protein LBK82_08400 [Planctomycetaceae bacterium]|jgi:uncharacterized repeat protein (TIGR04138 family)|nr:hypothetical protein [Planctomycetaceae bacterium]